MFFKSPHIRIALAAGACIIIIAVFSKRILSHPIDYLPAAIPPFLMVVFEALYSKNKNGRYSKPGYWIAAIFFSTAVIIILSSLNII